MDQTEFTSILEAARAGAEWAWSRLYADLAGPVRAYAAVRGSRDPDDVVGETFLQLARNLGGFEGGYSSFRSWVFVVAHHRVIDERRKRSRRRDDPVERLPEGAGGESAEDLALASLGTDRVVAAVGDLTADQRSVVMLRFVADLSLEQTAEVLGKRVGAVKALQKRAIDRLRISLPGAYPDRAGER